jgi:hypothetical protein
MPKKYFDPRRETLYNICTYIHTFSHAGTGGLFLHGGVEKVFFWDQGFSSIGERKIKLCGWQEKCVSTLVIQFSDRGLKKGFCNSVADVSYPVESTLIVRSAL